jgi:hypothetical protein
MMPPATVKAPYLDLITAGKQRINAIFITLVFFSDMILRAPLTLKMRALKRQRA